MIQGVTKSGFAFEVEEDVYDDMELLEALTDMSEGDFTAIPKVVKMLLGDGQRKKLYDHLRDENGRVRATTVMNTVEEIFDFLGQKGKNS